MIKVDKYKSIDRGTDPNKEYYINQNGTYISLTKAELEKIASDLKLLGIGAVIGSLPSVDDAAKVAVRISEEAIIPPLDSKEQVFFVAGFQECIKWLNIVVSGSTDL